MERFISDFSGGGGWSDSSFWGGGGLEGAYGEGQTYDIFGLGTLSGGGPTTFDGSLPGYGYQGLTGGGGGASAPSNTPTLAPINVTAQREPDSGNLPSPDHLSTPYWNYNRVAQLLPNAGGSGAVSSPAPAKTGLGDKVDAILAKSPTAQKELKALLAAGWKIAWATPGESSNTDSTSTPKTIYISAAAMDNPIAAAQQLAHELGHFEFGSKNINTSSPEACLRAEGDGEGAATINNIAIEREIIANGGPDIGVPSGSVDPAQTVEQYKNIYNNASQNGDWAGARDQIGAIYMRSELDGGTPPKTYRDVYAPYCDQFFHSGKVHPR